jgi:hypothetical protein
MPNEAEAPQRWDPFGPQANADETRQAQHSNANDAPTDVNCNAIVARSQALTVDIAGKDYQANADLRQKYADTKFGKST